MKKKNSAEILKVAWINVGNSSYKSQENRLGIQDIDITLIDDFILENIDYYSENKDHYNFLEEYDKSLVDLLKHYPREKDLLKNKKIK